MAAPHARRQKRTSGDVENCHARLVSHDVFFKGSLPASQQVPVAQRVREVVTPYVIAEDEWSLTVRPGDGEADLCLSDDSMMANHISGSDP